MLNSHKKVTIEWTNEERHAGKAHMSNPISNNYSNTDKLAIMVSKVLEEELPQLKNNSLLYDLVLYTLLEKMNTVQTVENVLSYIKGSDAREVKDVSFKNGEVRIKCSI